MGFSNRPSNWLVSKPEIFLNLKNLVRIYFMVVFFSLEQLNFSHYFNKFSNILNIPM